MLRQVLLLVHLLSTMAWMGGMFFAYFCLRPAAAQVLQPPQRLSLWTASLGRFLRYMAVAVLLVLGSGAGLLAPVGFAGAPVGWHAMAALGGVMAVVYAVIALRLFPQLRGCSEAQDWPAAAAALNRIRRLVAVNLALGVGVVGMAVFARG
ncbi:CopD family protein [Pelomonas sp. CA6]|uniref:CopD family protein n=1 Tax=Pelomonas sp. CA6 TaxID=2907999 RepID=UPI001F4C2D06|nr:CopD family protein [Pelomonas sp. CA6]MCH7343169.1 CopD family protein [Pelomonas sp. CA6]